MLDRTFTSGEVSQGLGVPQSTLQPWLNRGIIAGHRIDGGGSQGKHRQFTFENIMQIAIAAALVAGRQASVKDAFEAAGLFAYFGGPVASANFEEREIGLPFHTMQGRTILAVAGDRSAEMLRKDGDDTYVLAKHLLNSPTAFALLDVTEVFFKVATAYGADPYDVLDQAYGKGKYKAMEDRA